MNEKMRKCAFCRTHFLAKHIPTAAAIWNKVKGNGPIGDSQPSVDDVQCPNDDFSLCCARHSLCLATAPGGKIYRKRSSLGIFLK